MMHLPMVVQSAMPHHGWFCLFASLVAWKVVKTLKVRLQLLTQCQAGHTIRKLLQITRTSVRDATRGQVMQQSILTVSHMGL